MDQSMSAVEFVVPAADWLAVLPGFILAGAAMLVLLWEVGILEEERDLVAWLALTALVAVAALTPLLWGRKAGAFGGTVALDNYALFFNLVFCGAAALTVLLSIDYLKVAQIPWGEYYALVLFATAGMVVMAAATDLVVVFLGLETMSVAVYALAGIRRERPESTEAALKYFLLGAFASGFFLYGIALVYGVAGSTKLARIAEHAAAHGGSLKIESVPGNGTRVEVRLPLAAAPS